MSLQSCRFIRHDEFVPFKSKGNAMLRMPMIVAISISAISFAAISQVSYESTVVMKESAATGACLEVVSNVSLSGTKSERVAPGSKPTFSAIKAAWTSRYREKIVELDSSKQVVTTARRYSDTTLEKTASNTTRRTVLRQSAQRIVIRRVDRENTIFSPDAPLTTQELDLLRAEVFTPALAGFLAAKPVKVGDRWQPAADAASELTGIDPIQSGAINCTLREIKSAATGAVARVALSGTVSGPSEQGPSRQTVEGYFLFDLDHQLITSLVFSGQSEILNDDGKVVQKLEGRYELTRRPAIEDPRLSDSELAQLTLKPNAEVTGLLFDDSDLGVRFLHPRNWELASVSKNVIQLDEPTGGRLLVTVDPTPAPNAEKLRADLLTWLGSQKAKVKDAGRVQGTSTSDSRKADHFTVHATVGEKDRQWNYWIVRSGERAATVAANVIASRADALTKDVESIARSFEFLPKSN